MGTIHPSILVSLGFCVGLLMHIILEDYKGGMVKRGIVGCAAAVIINYFVPPYIVIAINIWTIGIACLFGIPGILVMYLIKILGIMR